jgi:hypothetical protein
MAFETSYNKTFHMLNGARDFHNRRNARKQLNLYDLAPERFQKSFFASKLHTEVASYVKLVYDASQPGANIVVGLLHGLQQRTQACKVTACDVTSSKVYICDIKQTKTMVTPSDADAFLALFHTCGALFDTELLHHTFINTHKTMKTKIHFAHSSRVLEQLREAFHSGDENAVGKFAAVLMWFLHTKNMNKIQSTDKLCTGAMVTNNLNISTRLHKNDPSPPVVQREPEAPVMAAVEVDEEGEVIEDTPKEIEKIEGADLDDWEDFDL